MGTVADAIKAHADEMLQKATTDWERQDAAVVADKASFIAKTVEWFLGARVAGAKVVLPDGRTPMARIVLKNGQKTKTVPQEHPLRHLLWTECGLGSDQVEGLEERLEALRPRDARLERQAAVAAAVSKALADDKKMGPVRDRIRRKREQDRQGLLRNIRGALRSGYDIDLVSEEDLVRLYREELVAAVLKE